MKKNQKDPIRQAIEEQAIMLFKEHPESSNQL